MRHSIIHNSIIPLIILTKVFSSEFLTENYDKIEIAFYDNSDTICVKYEYKSGYCIMFGFVENEPNGCYIGSYDLNGNPIPINHNSHYDFINFNGIGNIKAFISNRIFELFDIKINL